MPTGFGLGIGESAVINDDFVKGLEQMSEHRQEHLDNIRAQNAAKENAAKEKVGNFELGELKYDESKIDPMFKDSIQKDYNQSFAKLIDVSKNARTSLDLSAAADPIIQDFSNKIRGYQKSSTGLLALNDPNNQSSLSFEQQMAKKVYANSNGDWDTFSKGMTNVPDAMNTWSLDPKNKIFTFNTKETNTNMDDWGRKMSQGLIGDKPTILSVDHNMGIYSYQMQLSKDADGNLSGEAGNRLNTIMTNAIPGYAPYDTFVNKNYQQYAEPIKNSDGSVVGMQINQEKARQGFKEYTQGLIEGAAKTPSSIRDLPIDWKSKAEFIHGLNNPNAKFDGAYEGAPLNIEIATGKDPSSAMTQYSYPNANSYAIPETKFTISGNPYIVRPGMSDKSGLHDIPSGSMVNSIQPMPVIFEGSHYRIISPDEADHSPNVVWAEFASVEQPLGENDKTGNLISGASTSEQQKKSISYYVPLNSSIGKIKANADKDKSGNFNATLNKLENEVQQLNRNISVESQKKYNKVFAMRGGSSSQSQTGTNNNTTQTASSGKTYTATGGGKTYTLTEKQVEAYRRAGYTISEK